MKAHIEVDADSVRGLYARCVARRPNNDMVEADSLLHGNKTIMFADAGDAPARVKVIVSAPGDRQGVMSGRSMPSRFQAPKSWCQGHTEPRSPP